jgi:broad specificity phosphatase PhoE
MKILFAFGVFLFSLHSFAAPSRILIIRHGEKPALSGDLSARGYARARALVNLFTRQPQLLTYGKPVAIFAFGNFDGHSARGIETASPLAESLGLTVDSSFLPDQTSQIAQHIFETVSDNQKMVMIVWRHTDIQSLATALGVQNAPAWDGGSFDRIWQIDYDSQGHVSSFKNIPESLLPGDSN